MKKTEIKKRRVIEESAKLFYFNGYINTRLKEILEVCKIPKGSFYYYFKNKDDNPPYIVVKLKYSKFDYLIYNTKDSQSTKEVYTTLKNKIN